MFHVYRFLCVNLLVQANLSNTILYKFHVNKTFHQIFPVHVTHPPYTLIDLLINPHIVESLSIGISNELPVQRSGIMDRHATISSLFYKRFCPAIAIQRVRVETGTHGAHRDVDGSTDAAFGSIQPVACPKVCLSVSRKVKVDAKVIEERL